MQRLTQTRLHYLPHLLLACTLAGAAGSALADSMLDRARQRHVIKIGMQYLVPPYVAGAKYRTPEAIDAVLAADVAARLGARLIAVPGAYASHATLISTRRPDLGLMASSANPDARAWSLVPTGYVAAPMAIMRTDTTIKSWEQLKGKIVCVAAGGRYVGMLAAKYGAFEKVFKAPADALLDLRIGGCDATVHDSALLEELLKMPEWKKFSARLPAGPATPLAFIVPVADRNTRAFLQKTVQAWQADGYVQQQITLMAKNIAFEVYLDQNVPDCH